MTPPRPVTSAAPVDLSTLLSFRSSLRNCTACDLSANCKSPIPFSGDINPDLAIMGEAPGKQEDAEGLPFVGPTGMYLRTWLKEVGIDMSKVTLLNAVSCYPAGTPTSAQMKACRGWANGQLEFIRPKMLLTLGVTAFNQLRGSGSWVKLQHLHGKPLFHPLYHFPVFHSYHPAAYLRGKSQKYLSLIRSDLKAMTEWDGEPLEECYICGDELYRYDEFGMGSCERHSARAGTLFPDDIGVRT